MYGHQPPTRKSIQFWDNKLRTTGSLLRVKSPGISEENFNRIREAFPRSPHESICAASLQLQIPHSTVQDELHKRPHLKLYKIQMTHALKPSDQVARTNYAVDMLERIDMSPDLLRQGCFSGEVTFHVSGVVNRHNCQDLGQSNSIRHM
jgi:hypothetical protein